MNKEQSFANKTFSVSAGLEFIFTVALEYWFKRNIFNKTFVESILINVPMISFCGGRRGDFSYSGAQRMRVRFQTVPREKVWARSDISAYKHVTKEWLIDCARRSNAWIGLMKWRPYEIGLQNRPYEIQWSYIFRETFVEAVTQVNLWDLQ